MTGSTISTFLGEPGPFYRSVSIERDRHDRSAGRSYVLTPWLERSVGELLDGLKPGSTRRAWRIVGDFGVGKSALALALVQALDPRMAGSQPAIDPLVTARSAARMYPLVLSGARAGLAAALADAIRTAVDADLELLGAEASARVAASVDPFDAVLRLRDLVVETGAFDGLLVVIDEMGKFLETVSSNPDLGDVFRLQALAEQAARSGDKPLAIFLVLHQGLQSYAEEGAFARRSEWAKIAERFDELIFDHPLSHTAALLASALNVAELPHPLVKRYDDAAAQVRELGWLGPREAEAPFGCYPIHPATVPVMARFFAAFGQNERSLFGFAASGEPNSLRAFASAQKPDAGFYRLDHFFDYVTTGFGHRLVTRGGGDWDRIRSVLDGVDDADRCEMAVLKAVGVLNLIDAPDLIATPETLAACLSPIFTRVDVDKTVTRLLSQGLVFQRAGRAGLRLWTSRRVDLSALWDEAAAQISQTDIARNLPLHMARLPVRDHLLARRHSIKGGTNRRFVIRLVPASDLAVTEPAAGADGSILCILSRGADDLRHAKAWAKEITERDPTVVALVAPAMPDCVSLITSLLRYRWMTANAASLQEDVYAAAEIERGMADLEGRLVAHIETSFGLGAFAPDASINLYRAGKLGKSPPPVHMLVSQMCDDLFGKAPRVFNELINRHALTAAGAGARQRLIEAIFLHEQDADLGFDGSRNPPERALYLSVLLRGKVHRPIDGAWTIAVPDEKDDPLGLRSVLLELQTMLSGTTARVPVGEIYQALARRPYGIRQGLAPLLLAVILAANRHRIALYERGTYCPKVDGPAFMRILKSPEHFELQWVSLEGIRADVFRHLAAIVEGGDADAGMLSVVTPLVRFGADLPFHVQRSTTLDQVAAAIRDAILSARSPVDLIFKDLPLACGIHPFDPVHADGDRARVALFVERLEGGIAQLRGCYPALLAAMRSELAELMGSDDEARAELRSRAQNIMFRIQEQSLKTFTLRVADANLSDDAWIEALGGAVIGKPPTRWQTSDVALWRSRLDELASAFRRVEAASFGSGADSGEAVRLSLTHVDGREHAVVVDFGAADEKEDVFARSIIRMIDESNFPLERVLAALSLQALERRQPGASDGSGEDHAQEAMR